MAVRQLGGAGRHGVTALALLMVLFHAYTALTLPLRGFMQTAVHLAFALVLVFLLVPATKSGRPHRVGVTDWLLIALTLAFNVRILTSGGVIPPAVSARLSPTDLVLAVAALVVVFEASRRSLGLSLPLVAGIFVLYAAFGDLIPGQLGHTGFRLERILSTSYLTVQGIYGLALNVSATMIFLLILFGSVMMRLGCGQVLMDLASAAFGRYRGGPAKMGVVASALFGTMTGSGVANAAAMGVFTIPLMLRVGYRPDFAGAVEATASMGGQIMPPVMGAAAFIMAEMLGVPYAEIALAAVVPAILYFAAAFITVDLEAAKHGLRGLPPGELPSAVRTLREGWPLLLGPLILFYYVMIEQTSPQWGALWATIVTILIYSVREQRRGRRPSLSLVMSGLADGAWGGATIAVACAVIGVIIAMVDLTGLGIKLSTILIDLSGGTLFPLLVLTMVASIILGTGLPTVLTYIVLAVLAAPAMIKLGVLPIAAHLFVFYFGIIADLTPPVAISCVVVAGIAGGNALRTSLIACRLAIAAFIVPFIFVNQPALLLRGSPLEVILVTLTALLGIGAVAASLEGWLLARLSVVERGALAAGGLLLLAPEPWTDVLGLALLALAAGRQWLVSRTAARGGPALVDGAARPRG